MVTCCGICHEVKSIQTGEVCVCKPLPLPRKSEEHNTWCATAIGLSTCDCDWFLKAGEKSLQELRDKKDAKVKA